MTYTYTTVHSQCRHCQARGLVEHVKTGTQESIPLSQRQRSVPRELFLLPVGRTLSFISAFFYFAWHNWKQSGKRIRGSQSMLPFCRSMVLVIAPCWEIHGQLVALQDRGDWQKQLLIVSTSISSWYDWQASSTAESFEGGSGGQAHDKFPFLSKMP